MNADWLIPDWPAPTNVKAVFTTRAGGVSVAPFDSLNLGEHVGDKHDDVARNRQILTSAIGVRPVFLKQVHGTRDVDLTQDTSDGIAADAAFTTDMRVACTIMVADCLPVLLTDTAGSAVAAAHAGWRGLLGAAGTGMGVLEEICGTFYGHHDMSLHDKCPPDLMAWLGPCIGPQAFEVGDDVQQAFVYDDEEVTRYFVALSHGKWLADLPAIARHRLVKLGLSSENIYGNDSTAGWCTVNNSLRFFSHRRDAVKLGSSGRMAGCIWIE